MPGTLMDFISKWGTMKGLFSDNAKAQTIIATRNILHQYTIDGMLSEPHQQNQNPAVRCIQK
eukprot:5552735-Ditylum_brightwellii.AAC.1